MVFDCTLKETQFSEVFLLIKHDAKRKSYNILVHYRNINLFTFYKSSHCKNNPGSTNIFCYATLQHSSLSCNYFSQTINHAQNLL